VKATAPREDVPSRQVPGFRFITGTEGDGVFDELSPTFLLDKPSYGDLAWLDPEFSWSSVIHSEDWPDFMHAVRQSLRDGKDFSVACRLFHQDRAPVLATVSGKPIPDRDGKPCLVEGVISLGHEVPLCTNCREAIIQGEKKAREFSRNILSVMSHDIRSPIIGVIGTLQLLRKSGLNEKQSEFVTAASESCERILELAKNLLDLARVDSGQDALNLHEVNLPLVVNSVADVHLGQAERRGILLNLEVGPDFPETVWCDEIKFRQILDNLISNAIKFTPEGSVDISLTHAPAPDGKTIIILTVTDTGLGFDISQARLMFDQFAQICHNWELRRMGAGLGLSIVKSLVRLFGGSLCADSEPDLGTTFHVGFPARAVTKDLIPQG
jgi:hypothetical protein